MAVDPEDRKQVEVRKRWHYSMQEIWRETVDQVAITGPTAMTYASNILLWMITFMCLGRLGEKQLAGSALGMTMTNLFGNSVVLGLVSTLDILFTQANGAKQLDAMRVVMHRGVLVLTCSCAVACVILFNGETLLLLARQDPELTAIAEIIMRWGALSLWPMTMFEIIKRYFQAMCRMQPPLIVTMFSVLVNITANYVIVFRLGFGVEGVGASLFLANCTLCILMVGYYIFAEEPNTWWKMSPEAFQRWTEFMHLALPSLVMTFFEWGSFEVALLMISQLGAFAIATQTILMNAAYALFVFPAGVSTAAVNRVGNLLGAGEAHAAELAAYVAGVVSAVFGIVSALLVYGCRDYWPYIFTNDEKIAAAVGNVCAVLAIFEITDNVQTTLGAAVKGSGRPAIGAIFTGVGFWVLCVPLGTILSFATGSVSGMWVGYVIGEVSLTVAYLIVFARTDWEDLVDEVKERLRTSKETAPLLSGPENGEPKFTVVTQ